MSNRKEQRLEQIANLIQEAFEDLQSASKNTYEARAWGSFENHLSLEKITELGEIEMAINDLQDRLMDFGAKEEE